MACKLTDCAAKPNELSHRSRWHGIALLAVICLLCGCQSMQHRSTTVRLWKTERLVGYYRPAADPELKLYACEDNGLMLVCYREEAEGLLESSSRCFFLELNMRRLATGRKPKFISSRSLRKLTLQRIDSTKPGCAGSRESKLLVEVDPGGNGFTVYKHGLLQRTYHLPQYSQKGEGILKTMMTPCAIAVDLIDVCATTALFWVPWAFPEWAQQPDQSAVGLADTRDCKLDEAHGETLQSVKGIASSASAR